MALPMFLEQLEEIEKKIHVIWIGKLPEEELDNLKIWSHINQEYEINIWIDSDHNLVPLLKNVIEKKSTISLQSKNVINPLLIACWQNQFYQGFKESNLSFNEYTKQFMISKGWQTKDEIEIWIQESKTRLQIQTQEVKKYTSSAVNIRDVFLLKDEDFFYNEKDYYKLYLRELEEAHFVVLASDLLRLHILQKEGGLYLDTDMLPFLDVTKMEKNNQKLLDFFSRNSDLNVIKKGYNIKILLINELMKLIFFKKINEQSFWKIQQDLNKKFDLDISLDVLKELAICIKKFEWKYFIEKSLNDVFLFKPWNFLIWFSYNNKQEINFFANSFLISKRNSLILQEIKCGIKKNISDNYEGFSLTKYTNIWRLLYENIDTSYALNNTGPWALSYIIVNKVLQMHGDLKELLTNICSSNSIGSAKSTWFNKKSININNFEDLKYFVEENYNQILLHYTDLNQFPLLNIDELTVWKKLTDKKLESCLQNVDTPLTKIHFDKKDGLFLINSRIHSLRNQFLDEEFQEYSLEPQPTSTSGKKFEKEFESQLQLENELNEDEVNQIANNLPKFRINR